MRRSPASSHIHVVDTEVRSFDEALEIIRKRQKIAKRSETRKASIRTTKPLGIRTQIALALNHTRIKLGQYVPNPPLPKLPHPFKDLAPDQKAAKAREMYDHGHGYWGYGMVAFKRLAKKFDVTVGQIITWIEDDQP